MSRIVEMGASVASKVARGRAQGRQQSQDSVGVRQSTRERIFAATERPVEVVPVSPELKPKDVEQPEG